VLAQVHLLRTSPLGKRDRDVGKLLLTVLLRQARLPPMPFLVVMYRRHAEHARMLQIALSRGQVDCLVDATIAALIEALVVGRTMIDRLDQERSRLHLALTDFDMVPSDAELLTTELLSRHNLLEQDRKAAAARKAMNGVLQDIAPYATQPRWPLSAFHLMELYRVAFAPDRNAPIWRRDDPFYSIFPYAVPAAGIEPAMLRFAKAFDRRLLSDFDPAIVAALGFFQMMIIASYGRSDSDVGRLLLQLLLRPADAPEMPLQAFSSGNIRWNSNRLFGKSFSTRPFSPPALGVITAPPSTSQATYTSLTS
jgi:hypothetical protein